MSKTKDEPGTPTHRVIRPFSSDLPHRAGDAVDASKWPNALALERSGYIAPIGEYVAVVADRNRASATYRAQTVQIQDAKPGELAAAMAARDAAAALGADETSERVERQLGRGER